MCEDEREFNFRAWSVRHQRFYDSVTVYCDGSWNAAIEEEDNLGTEVIGTDEGDVLMPSIGMEDRRGNNIYEGDIITFQTFSNKPALRDDLIRGVVVWKKETRGKYYPRFMLEVSWTDYIGSERVPQPKIDLFDFDVVRQGSIYIVGNIYEKQNPCDCGIEYKVTGNTMFCSGCKKHFKFYRKWLEDGDMNEGIGEMDLDSDQTISDTSLKLLSKKSEV